MGTIRRLTPNDYPQIEAVIDSRNAFQGVTKDTSWVHEFKDLYVKLRLNFTNVFFYGNFDDNGELFAFTDGHATKILGVCVLGVNYTKKGHAEAEIPAKEGGRAKATIDIHNAILDCMWNFGMVEVYKLGPLPSHPKGRVVEMPGAYLADPTKYTRTDVGTVKAGHLTGDPFIDNEILFNRPHPKDQLVMRFEVVNPKFKAPEIEIPEFEKPPQAGLPHPSTLPPPITDFTPPDPAELAKLFPK